MNEKRQTTMPVKTGDPGAMLAWAKDAVRQVTLAWRLFWDQRVPLWTKMIPPAALAYVLFPVDLIPDVALGLGQLDDVAVLLIGLKLFIELAPPTVVREHLRALGAQIQEWEVEEEPTVIEGEYTLEEPKKDAEARED